MEFGHPDGRTAMTSPATNTSLSLLDRLKDPSDHDAWARLDRLYTGLLRAWFAAAGVQPADRDDLTQNALAVVLRRVREFEHTGRPGAFRAWLRSIATNVLREFWRARPAPQADSVLAGVAGPARGARRGGGAGRRGPGVGGPLGRGRPEVAGAPRQALPRGGGGGGPA